MTPARGKSWSAELTLPGPEPGTLDVQALSVRPSGCSRSRSGLRLNSGYCFLSSPTTCPSPHQNPLLPSVIVHTLITDTVLPFGRSLNLKMSSDSPLLHIHLVPRWCGCQLRGAPGPARLSPAHGGPVRPCLCSRGFPELAPAPSSTHKCHQPPGRIRPPDGGRARAPSPITG